MTLYLLAFLALAGWLAVGFLAWACCRISAQADKRAEAMQREEKEP
jgi:hypothetical protein